VSDVFLLGAGFSRAVSEHMALLADLGRSLDKQLYKKPELSRYRRILTRLGGDVELYLSYLSEKFHDKRRPRHSTSARAFLRLRATLPRLFARQNLKPSAMQSLNGLAR